MIERRRFLISLAAVGIAPAACLRPQPHPASPLRILMLGGTNFVGPHLVQTALDRGHEVTLFNRGRTNPHLFPQLEKLRGNRYPDRDQGLRPLATERTWDAVIDTWQAEPGCIDLTARMLSGRTGRYVYISSIAAYQHFREAGLTENGPLIDATAHIASFDASLGYRTRKRAGEQAVERSFGNAATVLRCTSILGYNYGRAQGENTAGYWAPRFLAGEPMLAPDDPTAVIQYIDVRHVAAFAIHTIERGHGGAYNVAGPEEPRPFRDYLRDWSAATEHRSPLVWVPPRFLLERGVRPFEDIQNWIPGDDPEPGFYRINNTRARARGLTFRPLQATIRDALADGHERELLAGASLTTLPMYGMPRAREVELIEEWRR